MEFLQLTGVSEGADTAVYVNPLNITYLKRSRSEGFNTMINFGKENSIVVKETPDEVNGMIKKIK